jgi:hypothetical protein
MDQPNNAQASQSSTPTVPARLMSKDMSVYYSNCAMIAMSPRDISLYFGRFMPVSDDKGNQGLAEFYERQVYMTVEQAEDLVRMLSQTLETAKARKPIQPVQA